MVGILIILWPRTHEIYLSYRKGTLLYIHALPRPCVLIEFLAHQEKQEYSVRVGYFAIFQIVATDLIQKVSERSRKGLM